VKPKIGIVMVRPPSRFGESLPPGFMASQATRRSRFQLIDLRDYKLPLFNEPISPHGGRSKMKRRNAGRQAAEMDGFILVTPEYNHGTSAVLKNALDYPTRNSSANRSPSSATAQSERRRRRAAAACHGGTADGSVRNAVTSAAAISRLFQQGKSFDDYPHLAQSEDRCWRAVLVGEGPQNRAGEYAMSALTKTANHSRRPRRA